MDHFGISFTYTDEESDIVDFVSVYAQGKLIRRDYFTNRRL